MTHELRTGGDRGYLRIATEEAFATVEQIDGYLRLVREGKADKGTVSLWGFYAQSRSERAQAIMSGLLDLDETRLADMDATGIDAAILSLTSPGVQVFDVDEARGMVERANDHLATAVEHHPDRFAGMTSIAPQDPEWSAAEIARGVELGFKGVMVNSHVQGEYLDDPRFDPIFRACVEADQPMYLHPQPPSDRMIDPFLEAGLDGAVFGFGVETGLHLLRLITSGIFDRYPSLRIIVGHGGEALPYWMYRLDYMHAATVRSKRYTCLEPLAKPVSAYLRENVYITTSGMAWEPAIKFALDVVGDDRVMYAMDYPYEFVADEVRAHDLLDIPFESKKKLMQTNAQRIFKLRLHGDSGRDPADAGNASPSGTIVGVEPTRA